jgi:uncharacterized membrane protein (DUF485 family)
MSDAVRALIRRRWRVAIALTIVMVVNYFGFVLIIAFAKPLVAAQVVPGVSLGIILGAGVIAVSWLLTFWYVRWANRHYDPALHAAREATPS